MSRLSGAYDLGRFTGACAATGSPLPPGAPCVVALAETSDALHANAGTPFGLFLRRHDYSLAAWDAGARPAGLLFYWRTTAHEGDARKKLLVDDETLLDLFHRLDGEPDEPPADAAPKPAPSSTDSPESPEHASRSDPRPQRAAFRFVLALLLVRKKLLRVLDQRRERCPGSRPGDPPVEREVWLLQTRGAGPGAPPIRVVNPRLRDDDVRDIAEQLGDIMQGDF